MTSLKHAREALKVLLTIEEPIRTKVLEEWDQDNHGLTLRLCHVAGIRRVKGNAVKVLTRRIERLNRAENEWRRLQILGARPGEVALAFAKARGYNLTASGMAQAYADIASKTGGSRG